MVKQDETEETLQYLEAKERYKVEQKKQDLKRLEIEIKQAESNLKTIQQKLRKKRHEFSDFL